MIAALKKIANMAGLEILKSANNHYSIDSHLGNVFSKYSIDCVLDVGANAGQYAHFLRGIGYSGWIVSFEPVSEVFSTLTKLAETDDKWVCYNLALGDEVSNKTINVYSSTMFSSFLSANEYAKGIWSSLESVKSETVSIVKLDDIFSEICSLTGASKFYLKLDTQGYDLNVFRGSVEALGHISAMQAELSLIHVYDGMPDPYAALQEFHESGFLISGMYPINRDESLAVIEFDTVLVKRFN